MAVLPDPAAPQAREALRQAWERIGARGVGEGAGAVFDAPAAPADGSPPVPAGPAAADAPPATPAPADFVAAQDTADPAAADLFAGADMASPAEGPEAPHRPAQSAPPPVLQVAAALVAAQDGTIEIALDPAELGPVRLGLEPSDGAMVVHLVAERPETLDLMRRHADLLARDLRELGYADVSFRFGSDHSHTPGREAAAGYPGAGAGAEDTAAVPDAAAAPAPPPPTPPAGTLDLRL